MAKSKSSKGRKIVICVFIILVVGGLSVWAILNKREPVITVQVEKAVRRNVTEHVDGNGRIQPVFQVKISPEVSGEIIALPVKEGQKVAKGDLLVKIKPDMYIAQRNSSEASYKGALAGKESAQANLQRAEAEFRRIESLYQSALVSESVYLEAKTSRDMAKAQLQSSTHQVEMAQAALRRAEEDLSKTTITSPLDGVIIRLNSQLGERVVGTAMMAGTEVMVIADLNEMEARVDIGEMDVVLIHPGQSAKLEVDAFKDRKFTGVVTEIANSSKGLGYGGSGGQSQDATKFEVKVRITEQAAFRPGMSVTAEIETRSRTNVVTVPIASVTTRLPKPPDEGHKPGDKKARKNRGSGQGTNAANSASRSKPTNQHGTNVTATNATSAASSSTTGETNAAPAKKPGDKPRPIEVVFVKEGERVKMVPVKRGISDDAYTEIIEGLTEGQEVISGGFKAISRELEDGKKVRIGKPVSETDAKSKEQDRK